MLRNFFDLGPRRGKNIFVLSVPYEGTVSFGTGARLGPEAMFRASVQIESYDPELDLDLTDLAHFTPLPVVHPPVGGPEALHRRISEALRNRNAAEDFLLTLGGDHSVPLPIYEFYRKAHPDLVMLQVDAHPDLRASYVGSPLSHACIMSGVLRLGIPLFQLGIRSVCREQHDFMRTQDPAKLQTLFAWNLPTPKTAAAMLRDFAGRRPLYISFDVDGMDPSVIPGTGTPEPGGISYAWIADFWKELWQGGGPELVGLDVCELAPIHGSQVSETAAVKIIHRILTAFLGLPKKNE
jgi:agmatinase